MKSGRDRQRNQQQSGWRGCEQLKYLRKVRDYPNFLSLCKCGKHNKLFYGFIFIISIGYTIDHVDILLVFAMLSPTTVVPSGSSELHVQIPIVTRSRYCVF